MSNINILKAREPFIRQVKTLLPLGRFRSVTRDRVGRKMAEPVRNDCFTTTLVWCTLNFHSSNFWSLKIRPVPPILTTLMLSLAISSGFQECTCSYWRIVSSMSLKFGKSRLPTCAWIVALTFFRKWQVLSTRCINLVQEYYEVDKNDKSGKSGILKSTAYTVIAAGLKSDGCCAAFLWTKLSAVMMRFFSLWRCDPTRAMASSLTRFLDHTQRRITVGRTPLDEWSARRRDLYLTTHNTYNKHPCPRWDSNPRSQQASGRRPMP